MFLEGDVNNFEQLGGVAGNFYFGIDDGVGIEDEFQLRIIVAEIFELDDDRLINFRADEIFKRIHFDEIIDTEFGEVADDDAARAFGRQHCFGVALRLFKRREKFSVRLTVAFIQIDVETFLFD